MSETVLAKRVVNWLIHDKWDVYQEVRECYGGPIADIIAVRGPLIWAIECKSSLTLQVLDQASKWGTVLRSVAVPRTKGRRDRPMIVFDICDMLRIGVLEVDDWDSPYSVSILINAPILRQHYRHRKLILSVLHDDQKVMAAAGSQGGYCTPFSSTMRQVGEIIANTPGIDIRCIMSELTEHHYSSDATARACVRKWIGTKVCPATTDTSTRPQRYYPLEAEP